MQRPIIPKSSDVILTVPVAYTSGFGAELLNAAVLTNKGLEITLNTTPFKSQDWRWDLILTGPVISTW